MGKYYFQFRQLDMILEALGKKEVRWALEYMYNKRKIAREEFEREFKKHFPNSEIYSPDTALFIRQVGGPANDEKWKVWFEISELGEHVYRYAPLLWFSIDHVLNLLMDALEKHEKSKSL